MYTIDDYTITNKGEVINNHTGKILKPQANNKGYLRVGIGNKLKFVHRLVAEKYIPNPNNCSQVNHKDGNKFNNNVSNLEWVSNQQNRDHAIENGLHFCGEKCSWSKLNKSNVDYIRNSNESSKELAKKFGVSRRTINDVREYKSWKY